MSVYSGFATRHQQAKYNNLLETLIVALKKRVIKFYDEEPCDEGKFKLLVKKIYKKMFLLEKGKFMAPKYSTCFADLMPSLNIEINYDNISECSSSVMSQTFSISAKRRSTSKQSDTQEKETPFKSKNLLETKRNVIGSHPENSFERPRGFSQDHSVGSIPYNTLSLSPHKSRSQAHQFSPAAAGVAQIQTDSRVQRDLKPLVKPQRIRDLVDLKELRGTLHMPKMEDFLPRKDLIQQSMAKVSYTLEAEANREPPRDHKTFRRQKYALQDLSIEEL